MKPETLNLEPEVVNEPDDGSDDDFDTPYRPAESIRLPYKEADFPIIMRQLLAASPSNRKVPIFISTLSPLGALATRLRVKYPYDIMLHAILLQTIIEAPPSTGKRCFAEVVRQIIEPTLEARDKQQRRQEQEYRERKNARTQNEKIGQAPKTTIRCIPPATSKTVIVKRADYYERILGGTSRVILVTLEDEAGARPALFRALTSDECQLVGSALDYIMQDTYTDECQLQPIQVMDTTWLDAAVDRFSSQTAKRVLEMKTAGEEGYRSLDHYRKRGSVNAYRAAALLCYLYQVENRMAAAGIAGAVSRTDDQIHRLCIKVYRFLASYCVRSNTDTTVFTRAQLIALIKQNDLDTEARFFISQWKANGWIIKLRKNVYQKQV